MKLHLHTAINQTDFISWCMSYTYEGESARLIAVCLHTAINRGRFRILVHVILYMYQGNKMHS